jgi:hypothetical protein
VLSSDRLGSIGKRRNTFETSTESVCHVSLIAPSHPRPGWMLTGMDLLHPFLLGFDLGERSQVICVGLLASRRIAQPTINVYTSPLCDCISVADNERARVGGVLGMRCDIQTIQRLGRRHNALKVPMLVAGRISLRLELERRLRRNVHLPIWTRDYPQSMTSWRPDKSELGATGSTTCLLECAE